jgi:hypothetical protein
VNRTSRAIVAALVELVEGVPVWDGPPVLYRLYLAADGEVVLRPVAVSVELWSVPHTGMRHPEVLDMIADQMEEFGLADDQVFGMVFCHEAWTVPDAVIDDYHAARQAMQMAGDHRLYEHPQRVEIRLASCVDRRGLTFLVEHTRGGGTRHAVASPGRGELEVAGGVIEALDKMVEQLTGVPAQQRRSATVPDRDAN